MQPNEATDPVVVREPDASKGARPVLRGEGGREASFLPSVRLEVALVAELISLHRSAFPLWERNDFLPGNHSEMVELMPRIFRPEGPTLGLLATKFGLTAGISVA